MITFNRASGRAVYTLSSIDERSLRSHEFLNGDGSSGRSAYEAKRRAFKRAEDLIYCHQDKFFCFLTLTYKKQHSDYHKVLNDFKNYFSRKGITYIAVVEKHKSGFYHIHAMTSELPNIYLSNYKDKRGQRQYKWADWENNIGITDVKFISGTDEFFKVHKYIFKYMQKSEKIGGRYFLKSRDLKIYHGNVYKGDIPTEMMHNPLDYSVKHYYNKNDINIIVTKEYYARN